MRAGVSHCGHGGNERKMSQLGRDGEAGGAEEGACLGLRKGCRAGRNPGLNHSRTVKMGLESK